MYKPFGLHVWRALFVFSNWHLAGRAKCVIIIIIIILFFLLQLDNCGYIIITVITGNNDQTFNSERATLVFSATDKIEMLNVLNSL